MIAFHRSGAVRIAVLFLALFACTVIAAFAVTYTLVREEIVAHLRTNIMATSDAIAARLAQESPDLVFSRSNRQRVAALFNADGSLVIGESEFVPFIGWREFPADNFGLQEAPEFRSEAVLAYGRNVGARILVVGEGMDIVEDSREALTSGLVWSLTFVIVAGILGAAVISLRGVRGLWGTGSGLTPYAPGARSRRRRATPPPADRAPVARLCD